MRRAYLIGVFALISSLPMMGQTFSSGSTGADGALNLGGGTTVLQLPDSGILNYTTVNMPFGAGLLFKPNIKNTPVIILAQGAVTVGGWISVSGQGRIPGPGGFPGGDIGKAGFGPAGGQPGGNEAGLWSGPLSLFPITGCSGSAGRSSPASYGAGGGGAIVIASSTSINLSPDASVSALGGMVSGSVQACKGAIRLVANSIVVSGYLDASVVRLEGPTYSVVYTGKGTPPVISTINPKITPISPPSLVIVSVGGYPVPSYAGMSPSTTDLLLPTSLTDPIAVVVQANNVPVGTPVSIAFSGSSGATSTTANLAGTNAASTATLNVSGMTRTISTTYLLASVSFDPSVIAGNLQKTGPDAVDRVELASIPGGPTKYRFLRRNGSEIAEEKIRPELRQALGM